MDVRVGPGLRPDSASLVVAGAGGLPATLATAVALRRSFDRRSFDRRGSGQRRRRQPGLGEGSIEGGR